jgi:flagellar biosynthesis/type III secretory pathway protein FliH
MQALLEHEIGPETKDIIVTTGQQLIEQGRQQGLEQGLEQGRQQGLEQGRQQAIQALLLRQLRLRFGDAVDSHVEQRVGTASAEQLETWSMRVISAVTLAELFAS